MGAIFKFAVTATVSGISITTVGTILMVAGILGLVISLVFLMRPDRGAGVASRERVVERDPYDPRL